MKRIISYSLLSLFLFLSFYLYDAHSCDLRVKHQGTVIQGSKFFSTFSITAVNDSAEKSKIYFEYDIHYLSGAGNDLVEDGIVRKRVTSNSSEVVVEENTNLHSPQNVLGVAINNAYCESW